MCRDGEDKSTYFFEGQAPFYSIIQIDPQCEPGGHIPLREVRSLPSEGSEADGQGERRHHHSGV